MYMEGVQGFKVWQPLQQTRHASVRRSENPRLGSVYQNLCCEGAEGMGGEQLRGLGERSGVGVGGQVVKSRAFAWQQPAGLVSTYAGSRSGRGSPSIPEKAVHHRKGHAVDAELQVADPQCLPLLALHVLLKVHACTPGHHQM